MPTSVAITGLSASYPNPGVFPQVQFAQGVGSSGQGIYGALLIANKTSAGSATPDTVIYGPDTATPLQTQADADALFGPGSEASLGWARFVKFNPTTPLYVVCPTESVGAFATGTITLTTTATAAGTLRIYRRLNDFVDVPINAGDTPTVIAAAATLLVNGKVNWPFTASPAAGVLTLTAKNKGLRGNWLRYWSRIFPACGTTTSTASPAFFTGGTTADSNTTALATILAKRFYFIVSAAEDSSQFGALMTQINTQALATNNIRQTAFAGSVDTLSNGQTIAIALNNPRASIAWIAQGDYTPFELACQAAAIESLGTSSTIPRMNFDLLGSTANDTLSALWQLDAPMSGAAPTVSQITSALNNGLSPIAVDSRGKTYLVSLITTRSLNGSNPDYQVRDNAKVFISDFYTDDLVAKIGAMMPGKQIANDPVGNQPAPGGAVVTPRIVAATTNKLTRDYFDRGLVQNVDQVIAQSVFLRESSPTTRMSIQVPLQVSDIWHQTGIDIRQVA